MTVKQAEAEAKLALAQEHFAKCVKAFEAAHLESRAAFAAYDRAASRRQSMAIAKNNAWGELEMARAAVDASRRAPQ